MNFDDIEIRVVEKLDLQNGDVLAVYIKAPQLSAAEKEQIKKQISDAFLPKLIKVLVVNAEVVKMQALRVEEGVYDCPSPYHFYGPVYIKGDE